MSGIEVVAAVSAIISAFHGGSELLKHIKEKRRKSRRAQQEFEEKQLQDSLVSGEQQIGFRYAQDMREFGDIMRVGDVIARDQLQHITIMMQGEVIKSLQMAVQYENAVLNLTLLYHASITNREETFKTLDQLKQRLLPRMSISRQLQNGPDTSSNRLLPASFQTMGTSNFNPERFIPDGYIPPAVSLPSQQNIKKSNHGLSSYFQNLKHDSSLADPSSSTQPSSSKTPIDDNFSQALQHVMKTRGTKDPAVIMQEIDDIMDSYQGLHISQKPSDSWSNPQYGYGYGERRDTLTMPSARDSYPQDPLSPTRETMQMPNNLPPTPEEHHAMAYPQQLQFNNGIFNQHQEQPNYNQQYPAKNPYPQMQTQASRSRWSTNSGSSSGYSDSPSLNRNSSTSSQESHSQHSPLPLNHSPRNTSTTMPRSSLSADTSYQYHDSSQVVPSASPASYAPPTERYTQPIAPLSPQHPRGQFAAPPQATSQAYPTSNTTGARHEDPNSLMYPPYAPYQHSQSQPNAPVAQSQQQQYPMPDHDPDNIQQKRPIYHLTPSVARNTPSTPSTASQRTVTQSILAATTLGTAPATAGLRQPSIAPSIASTNSSSSIPIGILPKMRNSIRVDTIQSGPTGQERMMDGRPCKGNNYWGFCKGAWTIREDVKKGLSLRVQPIGLYNSKEIWECTSCTFKGATFTAPHPTKKNKQVTVVDPRVITSASKIRYKWVFLAKSHTKKRATDSHAVESNFGCVFCSLEDRVSSVYGGVETLMNHIALCHVADMSENTRRKARCVIGRVPDAGETEWDINIPVFARVEELP